MSSCGTKVKGSTFNGKISTWNVQNVRTISGIFSLARMFDSDLSGWQTSSLVDTSSAFSMNDFENAANRSCSFQGNLSSWICPRFSRLEPCKFRKDKSTPRRMSTREFAQLLCNTGSRSVFLSIAMCRAGQLRVCVRPRSCVRAYEIQTGCCCCCCS